MIFESKKLSEISENDLQLLVENKVMENKQLDYKLKLPGHSIDEKKEFLADICSFANTSGGFIIYGVEEESGIARSVQGLEEINLDQEILRLESMVRDGIEPRIPEIQYVPIKLMNKRDCLLIKIPMSWVSPHMLTFRTSSKFLGRNSNGKYHFDVDQIRSAFLSSEDKNNKIRNFRSERLGKILSGETPIPINNGPKFVIHYIPLSFTRPGHFVGINEVSSNYKVLPLLNNSISDYRINLDGFVTYYQRASGEYFSYSQFFNSGAIEVLTESVFLTDPSLKKIPITALENAIIKNCSEIVGLQSHLHIEPPIFIFLSILNVKGYSIRWQYGDHDADNNYRIDRDYVMIQETIVHSYENIIWESLLKPGFDLIWNSAGYVGSKNYNQSGERFITH